LQQGPVVLASGNPLAKSSVDLQPGAIIDTASRNVSVAGLTGSGVIDLGLGGSFTMKGTSDFSGSTQGTGTLRLRQDPFTTAKLTPGGVLTHNGPMSVDGGSLILAGAGRLEGVTDLSVSRLGVVSIRSTSSLPSEMPISLQSGILDIQPGSASLHLGTLTGLGNGRITPQHVTEALQVDFAGLNRGPEGAAVFRIDADNANLGAIPGPGVANLRFGAGFSSNLVGDPGVTPIIPFIVGLLAPGGYNDLGLVTYDEANGVRMLTDTEYSSSPILGSNYRFAGSVFNDAVLTVNSLTNRTDPDSMFGGGTINITGGIAVLNNATIYNSVSFGARQGNIVTNGYVRFYNSIGGTGGLTLTGREISLPNSNQNTGPLTINGAFVRFNTMAALGAGVGPITIYQSGLQSDSGGTLQFSRPLNLAGGQVGFSGTFQFTGPIFGPGGLNLGYSSGMTLTGANSYSGPTRIDTDLTIDGDSAFGQSSEIEFAGGSLSLTGDWTSNKPVRHSESFFTLNTNGFNATMNGPLSSDNNFTLTKAGTGRWKVSDGSEFIGTIAVSAGTFEIGGRLSGNVTASSGTTVTGTGFIGGNLNVAGILEPGAEVGEIAVGTLQLQTNSVLRLRLDSATKFDRLVSLYTPTLGSAITMELQLGGGFNPSDFVDQFIIIRNDSSNAISISGTTPLTYQGNSLSEGEEFTAVGQDWKISYQGGSGNDVVLYAVPEPTSSLIFAAAASLVGLRRRQRRHIMAAAMV
jgi:autotransporter-associated beta strand protein